MHNNIKQTRHQREDRLSLIASCQCSYLEHDDGSVELFFSFLKNPFLFFITLTGKGEYLMSKKRKENEEEILRYFLCVQRCAWKIYIKEQARKRKKWFL